MTAKLPFPQLAKVAVEGFKLLQDSGQIGPSDLRLTKLDLVNDSALVASIIPSVFDSIGVKTEACTVMGFMASFFKEEFALPSGVMCFGVRAFSDEGDELMYVLSSLEAAQFCCEGKAIEWLAHSVFQDNTPEHKCTRAKLLVSRIEVGLRRLISVRLEVRHGTNWWSAAVPRSIGNRAVEASKGVLTTGSSGAELIEYTYLLDLKEVILREWEQFRDIFGACARFEQAMKDLNSIRRYEAHNRPLSDSQIKQLEDLYSYLAGAMTRVDSETVPSFLIENWRQRLATIVQETSARIPEMMETDRRNPQLVRPKFDQYVAALEEGLTRIKTVVVPPGKQELHSQLEREWAELWNAVRRMQQAVDSGNSIEVAAAAVLHEQALGRLRHFTATYLMSELGH